MDVEPTLRRSKRLHEASETENSKRETEYRRSKRLKAKEPKNSKVCKKRKIHTIGKKRFGFHDRKFREAKAIPFVICSEKIRLEPGIDLIALLSKGVQWLKTAFHQGIKNLNFFGKPLRVYSKPNFKKKQVIFTYFALTYFWKTALAEARGNRFKVCVDSSLSHCFMNYDLAERLRLLPKIRYSRFVRVPNLVNKEFIEVGHLSRFAFFLRLNGPIHKQRMRCNVQVLPKNVLLSSGVDLTLCCSALAAYDIRMFITPIPDVLMSQPPLNLINPLTHFKGKSFVYTLTAYLNKDFVGPPVKILLDTSGPKSYVSEQFMRERLMLKPTEAVMQLEIDVGRNWSVVVKDLHVFESTDFDFILGSYALGRLFASVDFKRGYLGVGCSFFNRHIFKLKKRFVDDVLVMDMKFKIL